MLNPDHYMSTAYRGEVVHVSTDGCVVMWDIEGDLVEQSYLRRQFRFNRLPTKGDHLMAMIDLIKLPDLTTE